ncbi:MAG: TolC family protein [Phycisphaerales bacterium]|jgi:cobalt-zinc-cadmium efflux system outer membrane protein
MRFTEPKLFCCLGVVTLLGGCAPSPFDFDPPAARPLLRDMPRYEAPEDPDRVGPTSDVVTIGEQLTLRQALAAALVRNPRLRSLAWEPRIAEARRLQAGLSPNPSVGIEVEDFAGSGSLSGFDSAETTIAFSQLLELGGKRDRRVRVAEGQWTVAALDYEAQRLAVLTDTASRFVRVLELQQRVKFAVRAQALAEENRRVIDRRVQAGDVSPIDEIKARLESESTRIAADRLSRELEAARRELSAMWDATDPGFDTAIGSLDDLMPVPLLDALTDLVEHHPEVQRWSAETERRSLVVALERAQAVSDVTAGAGIRYAEESEDVGLVVAVSVPLAIFDRNQGGILAARLRAAQAIDEGRASRRDLATRLVRAHARLTAAYHEAQAIDAALLPAAKDAYDATRRAYDEGKLPYLDVLDAQRTLFDTETQRLEALAEYHAAKVQVEGLISEPLNIHSLREHSDHPNQGDTP